MKRHGYYCRSRKVGGITRPRSCTSCARGKAGCDKKRPKCSRCMIKGIECYYPSTPKPTASETRHSDGASAGSSKTTSSSATNSSKLGYVEEPSNNGDDNINIILEDAFVTPINPDFVGLEGQFLEWDAASFGLADFLDTPTMDPYFPSGLSPLIHRSTPATDQTARTRQDLPLPNSSIPAAPSYTIRSFIQRPRVQASAQRIANLIFHTLKSYPRMLLRHSTLPPLIHPCLVSIDFENPQMEPLMNCISLVHMISHRVQGSRKLFWRNVRQECERLVQEVS